jgi:predicted O-linked N-acetylglucosamine transferase (SPINDLY family)
MTSRSLQDQVNTLLSRKVAEDRNQGRQSIDLEAAAIVENFATTLLLNPRVVLYFAHLARNGLLKVAQDEAAALVSLVKTVQDLGNVTYSIDSTASLELAKVALLQLENQNVAATGPVYSRFESAVSTFLDKKLSRNVRRAGATEHRTIRPCWTYTRRL